MKNPTSRSIPRLPASARLAGATSIGRCGSAGNSFSIGFKIVGADLALPGCGQAVVDAIRAWMPEGAMVTWGGCQSQAIILKLA